MTTKLFVWLSVFGVAGSIYPDEPVREAQLNPRALSAALSSSSSSSAATAVAPPAPRSSAIVIEEDEPSASASSSSSSSAASGSSYYSAQDIHSLSPAGAAARPAPSLARSADLMLLSRVSKIRVARRSAKIHARATKRLARADRPPTAEATNDSSSGGAAHSSEAYALAVAQVFAALPVAGSSGGGLPVPHRERRGKRSGGGGADEWGVDEFALWSSSSEEEAGDNQDVIEVADAYAEMEDSTTALASSALGPRTTRALPAAAATAAAADHSVAGRVVARRLRNEEHRRRMNAAEEQRREESRRRARAGAAAADGQAIAGAERKAGGAGAEPIVEWEDQDSDRYEKC